jgi:hypothetical protein
MNFSQRKYLANLFVNIIFYMYIFMYIFMCIFSIPTLFFMYISIHTHHNTLVFQQKMNVFK